ncbi:MAG TPA: ribonuclease H-like domain-containing protein [Desulfatirhabdiaceae bacterium]|nr:ribonuclease H-like domain-containing protein [Desulfatirhabdiaceae bacterium]
MGALSVGDGRKRPIPSLLPSQNDYLKSYIDPDAFQIVQHAPKIHLATACPTDMDKSPVSNNPTSYGVLDIETQRSAQEVGGWNRADRMGVSCAVLYDSRNDRFLEFLEHQVEALIDHLFTLDLIIGFNIKRFDYDVLRGYSRRNIRQLNTLDILEVVHGFLGYRLSLDSLAKATLGAEKSGDGLQALAWWKEGRIQEIVEYCRMDVQLTRDLYLYGRQNGYLLFQNKAKKTVRLPVSFGA